MENTPDIIRPQTFWRFMKTLIRSRIREAIIVQVFCLVWALDWTFFPYIFGKIIDGLTQFQGDRTEAWETLKYPILGALIFWVFMEICYRIGGIQFASLSPKLQKSSRRILVSHVMKQAPTYFSTHSMGTIANKIADLPPTLNRLMDLFCFMFMPTILAVLISIGLFASMNWFFALLLSGWVAAHVLVSLLFLKRSEQLSRSHSEYRSYLQGLIQDSLSNVLSRKLFSRDDYELDRLEQSLSEEELRNRKTGYSMEIVKGIQGILCFLIVGIGVNGYTYICWRDSLISVGDAVSIFTISHNIVVMVWITSMDIPTFFREMGIAKQALALLDDIPTIQNHSESLPLNITQGKIAFENVSFGYDPIHPLFKDFSITINPQEKVGLVGYSGSGKTTFVNLILRLQDILEGHITIDGQDVSQVTQESLREGISMIPQEPQLFNRSILENIRYGKLTATDEEVMETAKHAHAHEFIITTPEGYETELGDRGARLSGGQKQRIAIARAFLKNAPILMLDEATSALDSVTESAIQESLKELSQNKTTLVVAHRLSTLLFMDRILVFEKGRIIQDGSHSDLIKQQGLYQTLWNTQSGGMIPDKPA